MTDNISNNKRVIKNTIFLYGRMILLLCVSLYTSRVVLKTLGFEDFGIYNVVGGIVAMFSFINLALANSSARFITYALGKGELNDSKLVFNSSFLVHIIIALVIVILSETVGLWFLHSKMIIPEERMYAASWVFQFSVISCVCTILYVPFNAMIIAYEKMKVFAYISILDATFKLLIVYLITIVPRDRLIVYSFLLLLVSISTTCFYIIYCIKKFPEVAFERIKNFNMLKNILGFTGWSLIGNLAYVCYTQGLNILLNLFFGPIINAARGIAIQLQSAVMGFVTNFQMAVNPQITKSYAQNDLNRMHTLIYASSKYSFFLLFCIVLPISIKSESILNLWLANIPKYAVQFTVLTLFARLVDTLSNPIGIAINATGKIRTYQIIEGTTLLMIVPIAYIVLKNGGNPISVFWVQLIVMYVVQFFRLFLVCSKMEMKITTYCNKVLFRIIPVAVFSSIVPFILNFYLLENIYTSLFVIFISILSVITTAYLIGLENNEKIFVKKKIMDTLNKYCFR